MRSGVDELENFHQEIRTCQKEWKKRRSYDAKKRMGVAVEKDRGPQEGILCGRGTVRPKLEGGSKGK